MGGASLQWKKLLRGGIGDNRTAMADTRADEPGEGGSGAGAREIRLAGGRVALIRPPRPEDAEALTLFQNAIAEDYGHLVPEPEETLTDVEAQRRLLEDARAGTTGLLLAAFLDNRIAGTATLFRVELKKVRHVAELGLAVAPGFKGLGLGRALLGAALGWAAGDGRGLRKIVVRVFADNAPALGLYRSAGFVEEGRQAAHYLFRDGTYRDGIWMAKFLA
jgi:RimJ/RimL family protein N-acetyltransferase